MSKLITLPEKWAIKISSYFQPVIGNWFNKNKQILTDFDYTRKVYGFMVYPQLYGTHCHNTISNEYTLISFEDFLNIVANEKDRKIIGYKCPMNLFGGKIRKGDIYEKSCYLYQYGPKNTTIRRKWKFARRNSRNMGTCL